MEPGHQADDVVDGQAEALAERACVGRHVGAFEDHGADVGRLCDQFHPRREHVGLGRGGIELFEVGHDDAMKLAPVVDADDRGTRRHAGGGKVAGTELGGVDGDDSDAPASWQRRLHQRRLLQARGHHGHRQRRRELGLKERQEAAGGGDGLGARGDEACPGGDEGRQQQIDRRIGVDHARDGRHLDRLVSHPERPGLGIADVARRARKARVEHEDAEKGIAGGGHLRAPVVLLIRNVRNSHARAGRAFGILRS